MAAQPVEWVLVIFYGPSAHRATYGRLNNTKYTKDYIQLSKKSDFLATVSRLFPVAEGSGSVPLTYQWPAAKTTGAFVFNSADRPHLKWETTLGAPRAWKMSLDVSDDTSETIPGDPSHIEFEDAENELALLASRGAGQPYLLAIKLRDESNKLHLRAYLKDASKDFAWADIGLVPKEIRDLASNTTQQSALAWSTINSGGVSPGEMVQNALAKIASSTNPMSLITTFDPDTGRGLANYLRQPQYGLFFDPTRNHDAWLEPPQLSEQLAANMVEMLEQLDARYPPSSGGDAAAETAEVDPDEVESFRVQIESESFAVPDSITTVKSRGSAQRAFADRVKANYKFQCAITGIKTKAFLVAAHIVPWSKDESIRLDPSNGICLSYLVDRAFEDGYLVIEDDYTIRIDWQRVGSDKALRSQLEPYDGQKLKAPIEEAPRLEYLQRRRSMADPTN